MKTIKIISDNNQQGPPVWMAKYSDKETVEIMGTDTIPTPFFTTMERSGVVDTIQELNPDYRVY